MGNNKESFEENNGVEADEKINNSGDTGVSGRSITGTSRNTNTEFSDEIDTGDNTTDGNAGDKRFEAFASDNSGVDDNNTTASKESRTSNKWGLIRSFILTSLLGGVAMIFMIVPFVILANSVTTQMQSSFDLNSATVDVDSASKVNTVYANDNKTVIATFYAQNRIEVTLDQVSQDMKNAIIAREDRRFYQHGGVDAVGLLRAFINSQSDSDDKQGGSTITQQYVKNLLINEAKQNNDPIAVYQASMQTISRKMKEALLSFQVESLLSKDQILQGYLNIAPFGTNTYGVETAAQHFFSKHAKDLNVIESATIAAITKSPSNYDPEYNPDEAFKQRNIVLGLMLQEGYISQAEYDKDIKIPIKDTLKLKEVALGCQTAGGAAFFCEYVKNVILNDDLYGSTKAERMKFLYSKGLNIYTTLDKDAQKSAEQAVNKAIPANDSSGLSTALSSVEPGTGKIVAMAQNKEFSPDSSGTEGDTKTSINYNVDLVHGGSSGFSPGSTWKPFILASWLQQGYSLNDVLNTSRTTYNTSEFDCAGGNTTWTVHNASGVTYATQTPLKALQMSTNIPFVEMGRQLGLCKVAQTAKDIGYKGSTPATEDITDSANIYPAMLLGALNTNPLQMAAAYATFASGGTYCDPVAINRIEESDNKDVTYPVRSAGCHTAIDKSVAEAVEYALSTVITDPNGLAYGYGLDDNRQAAVKTGTAEDNYHLWAVGFTPQLSTAVWVGNAQYDKSMTNLTINGVYKYVWYGIDLAVPTWRTYMNEALDGKKKMSLPTADSIDQKYLVSSYNRYNRSSYGYTNSDNNYYTTKYYSTANNSTTDNNNTSSNSSKTTTNRQNSARNSSSG